MDSHKYVPMGSSSIEPLRHDTEKPLTKPKPVKIKSVEYKGTKKPAQFRLSEDLLDCIKLHAHKHGVSASEIVQECLSSEKFIRKCHVRMMDAA